MKISNFEKRDIVEVVGAVVDLEERGGVDRPYLIGLCPFHNDRNPSFVVFPEIQRFVCYSCMPQGGDVIDFVRRRQNLTFAEAVAIACTELTEAEAIRRYVENAKQEFSVDVLSFARRMNALYGTMGFEQAYAACKEIYSKLSQGNLPMADRLMTHYERC